MASITVLCCVLVYLCDAVSSNGFDESKPVAPRNTGFHTSFKDARIFTVEALNDDNTEAHWKSLNPRHRYSRIQATPEQCKTFLQGLTDASTGELVWDHHRCTVLTLVYKCHAKVRILSRSGKDVLAEGDDQKELFLEILVDDGNKRVIPLDGNASRELTLLLAVRQLQEGKADGPDFHVKKSKVLMPQFFGQNQQSTGFDDCP